MLSGWVIFLTADTKTTRSVTYVLWLNGAPYQKNCPKKQIGNSLWDSNGHVTECDGFEDRDITSMAS